MALRVELPSAPAEGGNSDSGHGDALVYRRVAATSFEAEVWAMLGEALAMQAEAASDGKSRGGTGGGSGGDSDGEKPATSARRSSRRGSAASASRVTAANVVRAANCATSACACLHIAAQFHVRWLPLDDRVAPWIESTSAAPAADPDPASEPATELSPLYGEGRHHCLLARQHMASAVHLLLAAVFHGAFTMTPIRHASHSPCVLLSAQETPTPTHQRSLLRCGLPLRRRSPR